MLSLLSVLTFMTSNAYEIDYEFNFVVENDVITGWYKPLRWDDMEEDERLAVVRPITELKIPADIKGIKNDALSDLCYVSSMIIEDSDNTLFLGGNSFNSNKIKYFYLGRNVIDEEYCSTQMGSQALETIEMGNKVTEVKSWAFSSLENLTSIKLSPNLVKIGDFGLNGAKRIKNLNLPSTLEYIGESAFANWESIETLTLPSRVEFIDACSFAECSSLKNLRIEDSDNALKFGCYYKPYNPWIWSPFAGCHIEKLYIGRDCYDRDIEYGNNLLFIYSQDSLRELELGNCVKDLYEGAFTAFAGIEKAKIGNGLKSLPLATFSGCENLENINFSEGLEIIGEMCFDGCIKLTNLKLPNSLKEIGRMAFAECQSIESLTIPGNVDVLGQSSFVNCISLKEVILEDSEEPLLFHSIEITAGWGHSFDTIFNGLPIEYVYVGRNIKNEHLDIWTGGNATYYDVTSCFQGLECLKKVVISDTVTELCREMFANSINLKEVTLSKNLISLSEGVFYNSGIESLDFLDGIVEIGASAFSECQNLVSVKIPDSVEILRAYAFRECTNLEYMYLGNSLKSIGLYHQDFGEELLFGTFMECYNLKQIRFPKSLEILDGAFRTTEDEISPEYLKDIYCEWTHPVKAWPFYNENVAKYLYDNSTLHIPVGTLEAYKSTECWCNFLNIVEDEALGSVDTIDFDFEELYFKYNNGHLEIEGYEGETPIEVFDLTGSLIVKTHNPSIDLPTGIYVIRVGGKTAKAII